MSRAKKKAPVVASRKVEPQEPGADRRCLATVELVILERDVPDHRKPVTRHHLQCCRSDRGHPADRRDVTAFHRCTPSPGIGPILWVHGDERVVLVRERPTGSPHELRAATPQERFLYERSLVKEPA